MLLKRRYEPKYALVPNIFIEKYMKDVQGDILKVYLWLLRLSEKHAVDVSVADLADRLDCMEKDVKRALKSLEKQGILRLEYEDDQISGIMLTELEGEEAARSPMASEGAWISGNAGTTEGARESEVSDTDEESGAANMALAPERLKRANSPRKSKISAVSRGQEGFERKGFEREDFEREGFEREGFEREGLEREDFKREDLARGDLEREGFKREDLAREDVERETLKKEGIEAEDFKGNVSGEDTFEGEGFMRVDNPNPNRDMPDSGMPGDGSGEVGGRSASKGVDGGKEDRSDLYNDNQSDGEAADIYEGQDVFDVDHTYPQFEMNSDPGYRFMVTAAERYLGRTLTPTDLALFDRLHNEYDFSYELIEYLIEYCVELGKKSNRYIETVALSWVREGKMNIAELKEDAKAYRKENRAVMKAFGITGRVLGDKERSFVDKWLKEQHFTLDVVIEACDHTMTAIQGPSFEYTDTILSRWKEAGVVTVEDARRVSEEYKNAAAQKLGKGKGNRGLSSRGGSSGNAGAPNRFHNFDQRNIDYDALLADEIGLKKRKKAKRKDETDGQPVEKTAGTDEGVSAAE